jgi:hypothetical protein
MTLQFLNSDNAYIFRITHRDNLAGILEHGLHARSSGILDPNFRKIGDFDLIDKRPGRCVPVGPGGTLSDYIPFYFTPLSMMAYNIHTAFRGIEHVSNADLVILFTSLHRLSELKTPFVFTDGHAYSATTQYFTDLADLRAIHWRILQERDFKHDPDDPAKTVLYQAEALIWKHLPVESLLGICTCTPEAHQEIENELTRRGLRVKAYAKEGWYFQ